MRSADTERKRFEGLRVPSVQLLSFRARGYRPLSKVSPVPGPISSATPKAIPSSPATTTTTTGPYFPHPEAPAPAPGRRAEAPQLVLDLRTLALEAVPLPADILEGSDGVPIEIHLLQQKREVR